MGLVDSFINRALRDGGTLPPKPVDLLTAPTEELFAELDSLNAEYQRLGRSGQDTSHLDEQVRRVKSQLRDRIGKSQEQYGRDVADIKFHRWADPAYEAMTFGLDTVVEKGLEKTGLLKEEDASLAGAGVSVAALAVAVVKMLRGKGGSPADLGKDGRRAWDKLKKVFGGLKPDEEKAVFKLADMGDEAQAAKAVGGVLEEGAKKADPKKLAQLTEDVQQFVEHGKAVPRSLGARAAMAAGGTAGLAATWNVVDKMMKDGGEEAPKQGDGGYSEGVVRGLEELQRNRMRLLEEMQMADMGGAAADEKAAQVMGMLSGPVDRETSEGLQMLLLQHYFDRAKYYATMEADHATRKETGAFVDDYLSKVNEFAGPDGPLPMQRGAAIPTRKHVQDMIRRKGGIYGED